jgi:hypothetical protein
MFRNLSLLSLLLAIPVSAQMQPPPSISLGEALQRTQYNSSLTEHGKPFHTLLTISNPKNSDSAYQATIEVFWKDKKSYRTVIASRTFSQTRIVNGDQIEEHNTGDFYPPWLQDYLIGILNPLKSSSANPCAAVCAMMIAPAASPTTLPSRISALPATNRILNPWTTSPMT